MELENGHFSERLTSAEVRDAITAFFAREARAEGRRVSDPESAQLAGDGVMSTNTPASRD